jgi:hypothetical protein
MIRVRAGWHAVCISLLACAKPEAKLADAGALAPLPAPSFSRSTEIVDARRGQSEDAGGPGGDGGIDPAPFMTSRPVWGKSIGHTSVVFKLKLERGALLDGGTGEGQVENRVVEAAYKPRSKRGKTRYRGEIAAYRLGRALGLPNVPPAFPRAFSVAELGAALGGPASAAGKLFADEVVADARGEVRGALIPWIAGLRFVPLEAEPSRLEWRRWLDGSESVPDEKRKLAAQISTMIVFDYLTGNWDRWSGGNIGTDETGETLLYIDNDGAFYDPPPPEPLARQRALVRDDARFSKSFLAALRALEPEVARAALGEEAPGEALFSPKVLAGLDERRRDVLRLVDGRVAKEGRDKVLAFE